MTFYYEIRYKFLLECKGGYSESYHPLCHDHIKPSKCESFVPKTHAHLIIAKKCKKQKAPTYAMKNMINQKTLQSTMIAHINSSIDFNQSGYVFPHKSKNPTIHMKTHTSFYIVY